MRWTIIGKAMVRKYVKYVMKVADQRLAEYVMKAQLLAIPPKTRMASITERNEPLGQFDRDDLEFFRLTPPGAGRILALSVKRGAQK